MDCEGLAAGPDLTVCQAARAAADAAAAAQKLAAGDSWSDIVVAILGAIGALALPVLAIVVLVMLWPLLRDLFETRKFTLKIGGFELSAQEATDQIRKQIEELQAQIAELRDPSRPSSPAPAAGDPFAPPRPAAPPDGSIFLEAPAPVPPDLPTRNVEPVSGAILWVDDKPSNNAFLIADFQDQKITVDQALSTAEALQKLAANPAAYRVIISDLGRTENNRYIAEAGADLARELRSMGLQTPLLVFSSSRAAQDKERLKAAGVTEVTNSSTRVRSWVMRHFKGRPA